GPAIFGAAKDSDPNRYDSIIQEFRAELAKAE
ncbi:MAG TPA: ribulose-phosphate 3-epimerase, partial [Gammaproteobacteria bacterium]|nr:ribulose-phosphate 3-epimerase [Gammaproteobacteria bacterium]